MREWQERDLTELTALALLAGVREIFTETAQYYTAVQSGPIPIALTSEMTFSNIYKMLVKRKGEPAAATFLFGAENQAVRAEKSLFDLAMWIKEQPALLETAAQGTGRADLPTPVRIRGWGSLGGVPQAL